MSTNLRGSFALACSGSADNCIEIDAPSGVSFSSGGVFTIGATFLVSANKATGILMRQQGVFSLALNEGIPVFSAADLGTFSGDSDTIVQANSWTTVVVSSDGSTLKLYVGGVEVHSAPINTASVAIDSTETTPTRMDAAPVMADASTRWEAGLISGYMREIFAVSRVLSAEEILSQAFAKQSSLNSLDLFADFNCRIPADKGKSSLPLQLKGSCAAVDLVRALVPGQTGYALAHQTKALKQAFASNIFTVYANVFTKVSTAVDDVYIFSCCLVDNDISRKSAAVLALGVTDHLTTPFVECGSQRIESSVKLNSSQWYSLALTVNGTALTLFVDGEQAVQITLTEPLSITAECLPAIGSNLDSTGKGFGSFGGYIDSVGVFSGILSQEILKDFTETPPFIFDEGCVALWHFSYEHPIDLKSFRAVTLANDAKVCLFQNTLRTKDLPSFTFREPTGQSSLTEVQTWQAEAAAQVLFDSAYTMFGIYPSRCVKQVSDGMQARSRQSGVDEAVSADMQKADEWVNASVSSGFVNSTYYSPVSEALDLVRDTLVEQAAPQALIETGEVASAAISETISSAEFGSCTAVLTETFYGTSTMELVGGMARLEAMWEGVSSSSYLDAASFAFFMSTASFQMSNWGKSHKSPEADDDTDTDDGVKLHLESLQFYSDDNVKKGSVCICTDFGKDPILPEYKRKQQSGDVAFARIGASTVPQIKAEFEVTAVEEPTSVRLRASVYGADNLLGALDEQSIAVTSPGTYTVDFPLSHHALEKATIGAHNVTFQWFADDELMGSTERKVHVLYKTPVHPWTAFAKKESSEQLEVTIPVLSLVEELLTQGGIEPGEISAEAFCSAYVDWIQNNPKLQGADWVKDSTFAAWDKFHQRLYCDFPAFSSSYEQSSSTSKISLGALDCSCIGFLLAVLEGFSNVYISIISACSGGGALQIREAAPFSSNSQPSSFFGVEHTVLGVHTPKEDFDADLLYDAYLVPLFEGKSISVKGLPFTLSNDELDYVVRTESSSYRNLVCDVGSSCVQSLVLASLLVDKLPLERISYNTTVNKFLVLPGRPKFLRSVLTQLPLSRVLVRCHALSFAHIELFVTEIGNNLNSEITSLEEADFALMALWHAVFSNNSDFDDFTNPKPSDDVQESSLCLCKSFINSYTSMDVNEKAATMNGIVRLFNSAHDNLRLGWSDWNSAIQENYDPQEWVHVVKGKDSYIIDCSYDSLEPKDAYFDGLPSPIGEGFYLLNPEDALCLRCLKNQQIIIDKNAIVRPRAGIANNSDNGLGLEDGRRRFLYSSSNEWEMSDVEISTAYDEAVYYFNPDVQEEWGRLQVQTL